MINSLNLTNIQNKINDFNLKKKEVMDYINNKCETKELIDVPSIDISETNIEIIKNNVIDAKKRLIELKKRISMLNIIQAPKLSNSRYLKQYNNSDGIFWGLGLENECYLQGQSKHILGKNISQMLGRERYSVDYTLNYDIEQVKSIVNKVYMPNNMYQVSQMINSHSLNKMDRNGHHKTTWENDPKPNPKFLGKTVLEEWFEYDDKIRQILNPITNTETNIFFDGDTIEFITENFYKTNTLNVVKELVDTKKYFIDKFNDFKTKTGLWDDMGEISFPVLHPGLNIFKSQANKIVFFNNTTIHVHITLPTAIKNGIIVDEKLFTETHSRAIRLFQWFEPFFICTLGSPDVLQWVYEKSNNKEGNYFSRGSMRATMSRYIGIGVYNNIIMEKGKLLTKSVNELRPENVIWWRDMINKELLYNLPQNDMGFDFNYGKHYQSGLEFRMLDGIPLEILKDVLDVIILICEHSYSYKTSKDISFCSDSQAWNDIVYKSLVYGNRAVVAKNEAQDICKILNVDIEFDFESGELSLEEFYYRVLDHLFELYYNKDTQVIKYITTNFNKINRWENFNKVQELAHIKSLESV